MKRNLAVLFGGRTCEHDVSIITGLQAVHAASANYDVTPIYIARDGAWYIGEKLKDMQFYTSFDAAQVTRVLPEGEDNKLVLLKYPTGKRALMGSDRTVLATCDAALPAMHGMNGEDGTLQGMLEMMNVPYTSAGVMGCALGMDKIAMKQFFRGCGFPTLPDAWLERGEWEKAREAVLDRMEKALPYPMFVKPANLGSSIGISRADDRAALAKAIDVAVSYDRRVLVEKGVANFEEVNCSVLGYGSEARASVLEMPLRWDDKELLDFAGKYLNGGKGGKGMQNTKRKIPAPISDEKTRYIQEMSEQVFRAMDLKGVVRIDYILDGDDVYMGEINVIPGSLSFYLWEPSGLNFAQLIDKMVEYAFEAHADKNRNVFTYDSAILKTVGKGSKR